MTAGDEYRGLYEYSESPGSPAGTMSEIRPGGALAELLRYSPDAMSVSRLRDARIIGVNEGFTHLTGHAWAQIEGKTGIEIGIWVEPEERERLLGEVIALGSVSNAHARIRRKDGSVAIALMSARLIDIDDEPCVLVVARDITDVRQQDERYRAIIDLATDGYWLHDFEGKLVEVNEAYCRVSGYERDEIVGMHIWDIDVDMSRDDVLTRLDEVSRMGHIRFEPRHRRKDGSVFDVEASATYLPQSQMFAAFHRDISDRKRAQEALVASEQRFHQAVAAAPVPMAMNDEEGTITLLNDAFVRELGYDSSDIPTLDDWWSRACPDARYRAHVRESWAAELERVRRTGEAFRPQNCRVRCKDGTEKRTVIYAAGLGEGQREHLVVLHDVTEMEVAKDEQKVESERVRLLLDSTVEGIHGLDLDGRIIFCNSASHRMLGYASDDEVLGLNGHELYHHSHADSSPYDVRQCPIFQSLATGSAVHADDEVFWRKDGSSFPVEYWVHPMMRDGEHVGIVLSFHDITERRRTEERLRSRDERYRMVTEMVTSFVYSCMHGPGEPYRLDWMAGAVEALTGYSLEDVYARTCWRFLVLPEDTDIFDAKVVGLSPGEEAESEFRIVNADGCVKWVHSRARVDAVDGASGTLVLVGSLEDVTARKTAEIELGASERRFRSVFESSPAGMYLYVLEPDGRLVLSGANPASDSIIGIAHEALIGLTIEEAFPALADTEVPQMYRDVARGAIGPQRFEVPYEDSRFTGYYQVTVYRTEPGRIAVDFTDVSDRKRAEREILETSERLERVLDGVTTAIGTIIEKRDPYTRGHEARVAVFARRIAEAMGLGDEEVEFIELTGLLHDVGKIAVPSEILSKPGMLSPLETRLVQEHASAGFDILSDIEFGYPVAEVVLQHHERMDGSGYPRGLKGDEILLSARILAVADVLEAMSTHRPYRPALGLSEAVKEVELAQGLYDPDVVRAVLSLDKAGAFAV